MQVTYYLSWFFHQVFDRMPQTSPITSSPVFGVFSRENRCNLQQILYHHGSKKISGNHYAFLIALMGHGKWVTFFVTFKVNLDYLISCLQKKGDHLHEP
jgi:hypothetical protein